MSLVLLVIHKAEKLEAVLNAWDEAGAGGITIFESAGLGRIRNRRTRDDIPLMPDIKDFFPTHSEAGRTIFTLVESEAMVEKLIRATEETLGDLSQPQTGVLAVIPTTRLVGHNKEKHAG